MILSNSRTLLEDLLEAKKAGFNKEFYFKNNKIKCRETKKAYISSECIMIESSIHETLSDPSDQSIIYLILCNDGEMGCLTGSYGTYADIDLINFCAGLKKQR
jgi:hypothetical protein